MLLKCGYPETILGYNRNFPHPPFCVTICSERMALPVMKHVTSTLECVAVYTANARFVEVYERMD